MIDRLIDILHPSTLSSSLQQNRISFWLSPHSYWVEEMSWGLGSNLKKLPMEAMTVAAVVKVILLCDQHDYDQSTKAETALLGQDYTDFEVVKVDNPSNLDQFKSIISTGPACRLAAVPPEHYRDIIKLRRLGVSAIECQTSRNLGNHDLIVFLDQCEIMVSTDSLSILVQAWFSATSSQGNNKSNSILFPDFIYPNTLGCGGSSCGSSSEQHSTSYFNPFDFLVSTSKSSSSHDIMLQLPSSTSMITSHRCWKSSSLSSILPRTFARLSRAIREMHHQCTDEVLQFWINMAWSGYRGINLPIPLLKQQYQSFAHQGSTQTPLVLSSFCAWHDLTQLALNPPYDFNQFIMDLSLFKRLTRPLLTVIVPYYNTPSKEWFQETLSSLSTQSFCDFEIVLVDDGSEPGTKYSGWQELMAVKDSLESGVLWYGSSSTTTTTTPAAWPIPFRIIRHAANLGLAMGRNTGVRHANGAYVIFLDPDDKLDPLALEKLCLYALSRVGVPVPHRGNSQRYGFVYSGTVHFGAKDDLVYADFSNLKLTRGNFMTATTLISRKAFIQAGGMCSREIIRYFEDYDFWLRMVTLGYKGSLLREPLFWYRRHSLGQSTNIIKDAEANRHQKNMTGGADVEFLAEVRRNNPVVFGDMSLDDAVALLQERLGDSGTLSSASSTTASNDKYLPCYNWMDPMDHTVYKYAKRFLEWRGEYLKRLSLSPSLLSIHSDGDKSRSNILSKYASSLWSSDATSGGGSGREGKVESSSELDRPVILFPINPLYLSLTDEYTTDKSSDTVSVMYIIPWMVMGGADLYDLEVMRAMMSQTTTKYRITIVVERAIPNHVWEHRYQEFSKDIFHLQLFSNSSDLQDGYLDYLVVSRCIKVVINSRTVAGYRAFERWARWRMGSSGEAEEEDGKIYNHPLHSYYFSSQLPRYRQSVFGSLDLIDILHLYNLGDRSNWEWRAGRLAWAITRRVVVSKDLKQYLEHVVGNGDAVLGKNESSLIVESIDQWRQLQSQLQVSTTTTSFSSNNNTLSLSSESADKIVVIYPPVDISGWQTIPAHLKSMAPAKNWWEKDWDKEVEEGDVEFQASLDKSRVMVPTVFFLGRLDEQKDPVLWLETMNVFYFKKIADKDNNRNDDSALRLVIIGSGPLYPTLNKMLTTETRFHHISKLVEFMDDIPHHQIPNILAKPLNAVLLITSRYDGVTIGGMEALALGVPVVSIACGGWLEVFDDERVWGKKADTMRISLGGGVDDLGIHSYQTSRGVLGSVVGYECEGPKSSFSAKRPAWLPLALANEVDYWLAKPSAAAAAVRRRDFFHLSNSFRSSFGSTTFHRKWNQLLLLLRYE